jgi:hypothetical protein
MDEDGKITVFADGVAVRRYLEGIKKDGADFETCSMHADFLWSGSTEDLLVLLMEMFPEQENVQL